MPLKPSLKNMVLIFIPIKYIIMKNIHQLEDAIRTLKNANLTNKGHMRATIVCVIPTLENFLVDNQTKDESFQEAEREDGRKYEKIFDDENPDYIKMSSLED